MTAVELDSVSFSYGNRTALKGVSFEIEAGQIFGLLGPNGCGKTTLFRIVSTLLVPDRGRACVFGVDARQDPHAVRKSMGVVFQSNSLDLALSAFENMIHQGHLYGLHGRDLRRRSDELLEQFGLSERSNDRVKTLSGGMRRRVELAKALLHSPRLLLLDEPTVGLDPNARREFWDHLRDLQAREGLTILLTTHSLDEADLCHFLVILNDGMVVTSGSPDQLKSRMGTGIVIIEAQNVRDLQKAILLKMNLSSVVVGNTLRIESERGHELVAELVENFPDEIQAVTVSKPTLEDVFIRETGSCFDFEVEERHRVHAF